MKEPGSHDDPQQQETILAPPTETIDTSEEDPEVVWLRTVYVRDETQLTIRSVLVGIVIGGVMCLSNLYVFFQDRLESRRYSDRLYLGLCCFWNSA